MDINIQDENLYRDIIVLFCPKKVGSTSIVSSIRLSASNKFIVYHTHDNIIFKQNEKIKSFTVQDVIKNTIVFNKKNNSQRKIYLIDIFRTPIERKISEYFEDISKHFNTEESNILNIPLPIINKRFNNIFPYLSNVDYYSQLYSTPKFNNFDFDRKYLIYESNGVTYIKLRLLDSNLWGTILTNILGTEITMIKDYETTNKEIGQLYNKFKSDYLIPYNFFINIKNDPELTFYLTKDEKDIYIQNWANKTIGLYTSYTKSQYILYKNIIEENTCFIKQTKCQYFDIGCICSDCENKREIFLFNLKNNIPNSLTKIIHDSDNHKLNTKIFVKTFYENGTVLDLIQEII